MKKIGTNAKKIFDHGTHQEFVDYYADKSLSDASLQRMVGIVNCVKRNLKQRGISERLSIADIGCGAGVISIMWAKEGHNVYGMDVNAALLEIARQRASQEHLIIDFQLGSATDLPWESASMDVCIAPELLEHVTDWQSCVSEFIRILKPNGVLFLSTTNRLCPIQQEFSLPLYSWYPGFLKRHYENLARTIRPEIAGYAKYPAVNWFSFYQLRQHLSKMGMESFDRFDIMDIDHKPVYQQRIIRLMTKNSILLWLGHVASPGLSMLAIKKPQ